jgi:pyridoxal phosphate enzyme (YggS family)
MGQVSQNLAAVRERIAAASRRAGRRPEDVRLMPVTKTQSPDLIQEVYDAGARLLGENKVQEAAGKAEALAELADIRWALIGHLQANKTKQAVQIASEFHALDSLKIARALDCRLQETGSALDVFIQVNSSGEDSKFGLAPAEVEKFAIDLRPFQSLTVRGLMTLAVFSAELDAVRGCFERMQDLQTRLRNCDAAAGSYDELSMGMSGDFELAIACGATTVRVGQAIFGPRPSAE